MPWLLTLILALALLFVPGVPAPAQMPAIDPAPADAGSEQLRPWWDTISASRCGRFWCSDVVLSRLASAQQGEMVLAYQPSPGMGGTTAALQVERRAEAVQVTLAELRQAMLRRWRQQPLAPLPAPEGEGRLFWLFTKAKPLHPFTPPVAIGIRNKATVLYLPDAADALLPRQVLGPSPGRMRCRTLSPFPSWPNAGGCRSVPRSAISSGVPSTTAAIPSPACRWPCSSCLWRRG